MSRLVCVCALLFGVLAAALHAPSSFAQDQTPETSEDKSPSAAEPPPPVTVAPPASAENATDGLPAEVMQPGIDIEELEIRLVPLTKSELKALAGKWLQIVKSKTVEVMEAQITVSKTDGEVQEAEREKLTKLYADRNGLFDKYDAVVGAWEKKGGDEAAIADFRAYQSSIYVEETRKADAKTLMARWVAWLGDEDGGIALAKNIAIVLLSFLALIVVARIVRKFVRRWIDRVPNTSDLLQAFIVGIVYWLVLAFGLMLVLSGLGVDVTPLFALFGGASIIAAFAMQDSLSNLAAGLMIMIYRPFDAGDYVDIGGVAGTVKNTNIVATTVTTPDNKVIVIPNKNVWGNVITNVTASDTRRVDLVFGISYDDSIPEAMRILEEAVAAHPLILKDPEPTIRVNELADSSVNLICRPWVKTDDYWAVYWDMMRFAKELFDAAGISIPYPQQDVHVINNNPNAPSPTAAGAAKRPATGSVSIAAGDDDI